MTNIRRILLDRQRAFDEAMRIKGSVAYWKKVLLKEDGQAAKEESQRENSRHLKGQGRQRKLVKVPSPVFFGGLRVTSRY
jgi:hypothetical protein